MDKPEGWTSRKALNVVQKRLKVRGGYEGTLDPFASGLLLVAVGRYTRFLQFFTPLLKEYVAVLELGRETDTLDSEGEVVAEAPVPDLSEERVREVLRGFTGEIEQIPPRYSAIRISGRRAYDLARRGEEFTLKPRRVFVESMDLLFLEGNRLGFRCRVGRGTYVRALGRDIARALGSVGHLVSLRRTAIGDLEVRRAKHPHEVKGEDILPVEEVLYWMDAYHLTGRWAERFLKGGKVPVDAPDGLYRVYVGGEFVGIGESSGGYLKPRRLLPV